MKRVICHILSVDENEDEEELKLKEKLKSVGFDVGEVCRNLGYQDTLDKIYGKIFPHRTQSEVK